MQRTPREREVKAMRTDDPATCGISGASSRKTWSNLMTRRRLWFIADSERTRFPGPFLFELTW